MVYLQLLQCASIFSAVPCLHTSMLYASKNTASVNALLGSNTTLSIGKGTFPMMGGVEAHDLEELTIDIQGNLNFGAVPVFEYPFGTPFFNFTNMSNFKMTSSTRTGQIWGGGEHWYGFAELLLTDDKPITVSMMGTKSNGVEISHLRFIQPPYWTLYLEADHVEVHHVNVFARSKSKKLGAVEAFNTDGIDVSGDHVHIHDCSVHVGDDCIAVKGGSHWLVERIEASGLGMSIGAHGVANNITFRDIRMNNTVRVVYIKTEVHDILYQNISADYASWFPIWIGPAYQFLTGDCPLTWPFLPAANRMNLSAICVPSTRSFGTNIKLVDIRIEKSASTPFLLLGNEDHYDIELKNVEILSTPSSDFPFSNETACYNVSINESPCNIGDCVEAGPRDPLVPCCGDYSPNGDGHWGTCL